MARGGINKALVRKAKQALVARGARPTIDSVRIELGNTGSKSTIQRYLKELSEEGHQESAVPTLTDELLALISPVAERLHADAQSSIAAEHEALAREQNAYRSQRQHHLERIQQLQSENSELSANLQEIGQQQTQLRAELQLSEVERVRLLQVEKGLRQILDERAAHAQSLEDKLQHARLGLEHYRESQQKQRTQELQRHDGYLQQLHTDNRNLQDDLILKQQEISNLNRDNQRLLSEAKAQARQIFELERESTMLHRQIQAAKIENQQAQTDLQKSLNDISNEKAVLEERFKRHLVQHRQCRRQIQAQGRQLLQLQSMIKGALSSTAFPPEDALSQPCTENVNP